MTITLVSLIGLLLFALAVGALVQKLVSSLATDIVAFSLGFVALIALTQLPAIAYQVPCIDMAPTLVTACVLLGGILNGYQHRDQRRLAGS